MHQQMLAPEALNLDSTPLAPLTQSMARAGLEAPMATRYLMQVCYALIVLARQTCMGGRAKVGEEARDWDSLRVEVCGVTFRSFELGGYGDRAAC